MVFNDDQDRVEEVMDCVESKNERGRGLRGFGEAREAIFDCAAEVLDDVPDRKAEEITRQAERWLEDATMEPSAVMETWEGERLEVTPYTSPLGFKASWTSTDAWRGYYTIDAPSGWTQIQEDTILSFSESEKQLADEYERIKDIFNANGIEWVALFPRTSNVFATGLELYVKKGSVRKAKELLEEMELRESSIF